MNPVRKDDKKNFTILMKRLLVIESQNFTNYLRDVTW